RKNQSQSSPGRRDEILRVLKGSSHPLSIADIADQLGVHPNTVRFHLDRLVANGQVERVSPQQRVPGRPPQLFRAVAGMDPAGPRQYRMLAEILAGTLNTADSEQRNRAVEAGRRWGHQHCASPDTGSGAPDDPI
ncbi:helix-turn-helix domain-containing protein, partial [Klebsiella pneumoniae]|nr:helix-turn-helix domain-containing protein [Klebsiella pneumoniae]